MADEITNAILTSAQGPSSVEADGLKYQAHSLKDMIEADKYLAGKAASAFPSRGLRFTKLIPPGTV